MKRQQAIDSLKQGKYVVFNCCRMDRIRPLKALDTEPEAINFVRSIPWMKRGRIRIQHKDYHQPIEWVHNEEARP